MIWGKSWFIYSERTVTKKSSFRLDIFEVEKIFKAIVASQKNNNKDILNFITIFKSKFALKYFSTFCYIFYYFSDEVISETSGISRWVAWLRSRAERSLLLLYSCIDDLRYRLTFMGWTLQRNELESWKINKLQLNESILSTVIERDSNPKNERLNLNKPSKKPLLKWNCN